MERIAAESGIGIELVRSRKSFWKENRVKEVLEKWRNVASSRAWYVSSRRWSGAAATNRGADKKSHKTHLKPDDGECLHYYVYFIGEDLGLYSVRAPAWCPSRLQVYCNGQSVLAQRAVVPDDGVAVLPCRVRPRTVARKSPPPCPAPAAF
jgi:hypothetical protein